MTGTTHTLLLTWMFEASTVKSLAYNSFETGYNFLQTMHACLKTTAKQHDVLYLR